MTLPGLPAQVVDGARTADREELAEDVRQVAAGLAERGVAARDRLVTCLPPTIELVVVQVAAEALGAAVVTLPPSARREVGQAVRMAHAGLTVLEEGEDLSRYGDLRQFVALPRGTGALDVLRGDARRALPGSGERVWLAPVVGPTGVPRAAIHTRRSLAGIVSALASRFAVSADDTVLAAGSPVHPATFCLGLRLACELGSRLLVIRDWDPDAAMAAMNAQRCTFAALPADLLRDLIDAGAGRPWALRRLLVGPEPVIDGDLREAAEMLGAGTASRWYGTSECGLVADGDGVLLPGAEARVLDSNGGPAPAGEVGELLVRGPQLARGYWRNNDARAQFRSDGWFATGSRATIDSGGRLEIVRRPAGVVARPAAEVGIREIEEATSAHPQLDRAVVVGVADHRLREEVVAVAAPVGDGPDLASLHEWLDRCAIARDRWPDRLSVVDAIPRTASGAVDRAAVRELAGRWPA